MDPRKAARKESEKITEEAQARQFSTDRLSILPIFDGEEERFLRILPHRIALQHLVDHPEESFEDYCSIKKTTEGPWAENITHFNVAGTEILSCLQLVDKPCPVCEAYEEDRDSDNEIARKAARDIRPQKKYLFFVEWRGHKSEGPFAWILAPKWANKIFRLVGNPDYNVLYDPYEGQDLRVVRHGTEYNNTEYEIDRRPNTPYLYSVVGEDEDGEYEEPNFEKMKEVAERLPVIEDYYKPIFGYEEYERVLDGEITISELYAEKFGDGDAGFDPDEIEKGEKKEKKETVRRRRRHKKR